MMNNRQLAEAFTMIADLLEIKGEIVYKTLAYRKAADSLLENTGQTSLPGLNQIRKDRLEHQGSNRRRVCTRVQVEYATMTKGSAYKSVC